MGDRPAFLADLFPVFLYRSKEFMADNRLMGASGNNQVVIVSLDLLVVHHLCFACTRCRYKLRFLNLHYRAGLPFAAPNQAGAGDFTGWIFCSGLAAVNPHFN